MCAFAQLSSQPHHGRAGHGSRHYFRLAATANCGGRQSAVRALKHCWLPANACATFCAGSRRLENPALLSFALTPIFWLPVSRRRAVPWRAQWPSLAWPMPRHVFLHGCGASDRAQTLPPGWKAIFLPRRLRARSTVSGSGMGIPPCAQVRWSERVASTTIPAPACARQPYRMRRLKSSESAEDCPRRACGIP